MVTFGFFASLEEFTPRECLEQIAIAETYDFETVWVNDHFHPWMDHLTDGSKANGGNAWTWMGPALERTDDLIIGTGVSAVLHRYHPANVAHRLATLMELYPGRVVFGLGTGEALNECPLGYPWPEYGERAKRTAEAIRIIRMLFEDEFVTYEGEFWSLDAANLYTSPGTAPPIHVAAWGETTSRMAGDLADGFITVYQMADRMDGLYDAIHKGIDRSERNGSFEELEKTIMINCSFAETEEAALEPCLPWRHTLLPFFFEYGVHDPRYLQSHGDLIGTEALYENFLISSDPSDYAAVVEQFVELGFEQVVWQSKSPDQESFCRMIRDEVMPEFA